MLIRVVMHGKPKNKNILELLKEYSQKISRFQKLDWIYEKEFSGVEQIMSKYAGPNKKIFLLDEDGKQVSTDDFSFEYEKNLNESVKEMVFVVGPAEGFGDLAAMKPIGTKTLSLSKLAMQHDLAALVLVEQIYRVVSIKNNLPYHRI